MAAIIELYANNAYSILANSINSSVTTINVAPGTGSRFPSPVGDQFFRLTITGASSPNTSIEIVYVTSRSSDAFTVLRGQEGTTAQSWTVSDLCANEPTAGMFNQFVQPFSGIDTGVVNAYVVRTPQHESAYYSGMPLVFYTLNSNTTTTPTLNLNGLGAKQIKNIDNTSLSVGQLIANSPIYLIYSEQRNAWILESPMGFQRSLNLTASRAMVTDSSGTPSTSAATSTEVGYLSGVSSAIQTQLNSKVEFSDFYSGSGYQVLPSGMIMQWGSKEITGSGAVTSLTNLPVSFSNTNYQIVISDVGPGAYSWGASPYNNTNFYIYKPKYVINQGAASASLTLSTTGICRWIAVGY